MRYDKEHFEKIVKSRKNNGKPWVSEEQKLKISTTMKGNQYISPNKIRICIECCKNFEITANAQKRCKICAKIVHKRNCKEYRKNNLKKVKKQIAIYASKWRKTEHGKQLNRYYSRKRRLRKKLIIETFTLEEWNKKLDSTNGICPGCNKFIGKLKLELDHIIPISKVKKGFIYTINDVQPLCRSCNAKKRDKIEDKDGNY